MESLIIVAHGSRVESSNKEILDLINRIKSNLENEDILVLKAFLELV